MEQVLHGSARTTPAVRRAIQASSESLAKLAARYGLDPKTVAKWRGRTSVADAPMGPENPVSTVLSPLEEAAAVAFFKAYPLGYFHVDFAAVRTEEGKVYLFVASDRTSKLAFAELPPEATAVRAADFWQRVVAAVPYSIVKVLTDNGVQFTQLPHRRRLEPHLFAAVCAAHGIGHRCTQVAHPWTNGQVERLNRTLKEATIRRCHYQDEQALHTHLQTFLRAYKGGKRLKKLRGKTPYEFICAEYAQNPGIFIRDPTHYLPGLYTLSIPFCCI